jgi:hypothetical protein
MLCEKHDGIYDENVCLACENEALIWGKKELVDILEQARKERDELDRKRAQLELEKYEEVKLVALRDDQLALERKRSAEAEARASLNEKALELACECIRLHDYMSKEERLGEPDYFRKKAGEGK